MELMLVRHSRSLGDDENRIEGESWDAPLTAQGLQQAKLLAARLVREGYSCDALYSSPLRRAAEVARVVCTALGGPEVTLDARLAELDLGELGGLTMHDASRLHPQPPGGMRSYRPLPGGESHYDHVARVLSFLAQPYDERASDTVCVIAHGGTLSLMLQAIYGTPLWAPYLERQWYRFRTGDTGVHRLTIDGRDVVTHFLNDTSHLQGPTNLDDRRVSQC